MPLLMTLEAPDPEMASYAGRKIEVVQRLTIGRGTDNDLVLPDPERMLSKSHCTIEYADDAYVVIDGSTNGVFLNYDPDRLPPAVPTRIGVGDTLQLGGFRLIVVSSTPPESGRPAVPDLVDDVLEGRAAPVGSDAMERARPFGQTPIEASTDPLFGFGGQPEPEPPTPYTPPESIIAEDDGLFGFAPREEEWQGPAQEDHAPAPLEIFVPGRVSTERIPDDWDPAEEFGLAAAPPMPEPEAPAPIAPAPVAAAPAPRAMPTDRVAIDAFFAGCGLDADQLSDKAAIETLGMAGRALRLAIAGLAEVLAARTSTKAEFQMNRTLLGVRENNPLKFVGNADDALRVLLLQPIPGFLPADQAVGAALEDIKAHQIAVLAGMQAALTTVVHRFEPAQLEGRLDRASLIEGILPAARKARYWELFKALYAEIARELEDDLLGLFGADFARAYQNQEAAK
jgi:type VI secretion system FHA domain protein